MSARNYRYATIDLRLPTHPKSLEVGEGALGVFVASICYCQEHETDGRIPIKAAKALVGGGGERQWEELVRIGWWKVVDNHIEVFNYLSKNDSKADLEKARERIDREMAERREYMREYRRRKDLTSHSHAPHGIATAIAIASEGEESPREEPTAELPPEAEPVLPELPESAPRLPTPRQLAYSDAYVKGIRAGTKRTFAFDERGRAQLHQLIDAHARPMRGAPLLAWITLQAETFARWLNRQNENEARFWSGYQAPGCLRFLNERGPKPLPAAKAPPEARQAPANGHAAPDLVPLSQLASFDPGKEIAS